MFENPDTDTYEVLLIGTSVDYEGIIKIIESELEHFIIFPRLKFLLSINISTETFNERIEKYLTEYSFIVEYIETYEKNNELYIVSNYPHTYKLKLSSVIDESFYFLTLLDLEDNVIKELIKSSSKRFKPSVYLLDH